DLGVRQLGHLIADARRSRALSAMDGQKRLRHRDRDLGRLEADNGAVAPDNLVLREPGIGRACDRTARLAHDQIARRRGRWGLLRSRGGLHGRISNRNRAVALRSGTFAAEMRISRALPGLSRGY